MGAQVSVIHSDLMAKAARTNYAGAGGTKVSLYNYQLDFPGLLCIDCICS